MLKESAKHLFYVLFSWAIPFAFVGYAWCKSHVKALVYSNYDGKADIYFVCFLLASETNVITLHQTCHATEKIIYLISVRSESIS
jgi:hypothetical protein